MSVKSTDLDTVHKLNERLKNYSKLIKRGAYIDDVDLSIRKTDDGTEREKDRSLKFSSSVFLYESRDNDAADFLKEANDAFRHFVCSRIITVLGELADLGVKFTLDEVKDILTSDTDTDASLFQQWEDDVIEAINPGTKSIPNT